MITFFVKRPSFSRNEIGRSKYNSRIFDDSSLTIKKNQPKVVVGFLLKSFEVGQDSGNLSIESERFFSQDQFPFIIIQTNDFGSQLY